MTPILRHQFNWDNLSMAAGITLWQFYFRLYEGTMGKEEVRGFVQHLWKQIHKPMLLIWGRPPGHRSRVVADYVATLDGNIELHYLPAYAPELNPVEYIWAHLKQHELPNFCPRDLWHLSDGARSALRAFADDALAGKRSLLSAPLLTSSTNFLRTTDRHYIFVILFLSGCVCAPVALMFIREPALEPAIAPALLLRERIGVLCSARQRISGHNSGLHC